MLIFLDFLLKGYFTMDFASLFVAVAPFATLFLVGFIGAITPGPDVLLVLRNTLRFGVARGFIVFAGIASGWVVYLALVYFGLAHFASHFVAQVALSVVGSAYLWYISYKIFTAPQVVQNIAEKLVQNPASNISKSDALENNISENSAQDTQRIESANIAESIESAGIIKSAESTDPASLAESAKSTSATKLAKSARASVASTTSASDSTKSANATDSASKSFIDSAKPDSYWRALFINLSNPKAILFFAVIATRFIGSGFGLSIVVLFCSLASAFVCVILVGAFLRQMISDRLFWWIDRVSGSLFAIFGCLLLYNAFTTLNENL